MLQPQLTYQFRVLIENANWSDQMKKYFSTEITSITVNYIDEIVEIFIRNPIDGLMNDMILDMKNNPIRKMKLDALDGNRNTTNHSIWLYNCKLIEHHLRYDYSVADPCYHYLALKFDEARTRDD